MRFAAAHTSTGHTHILRMDGKVFGLGSPIITVVQSTQSIMGVIRGIRGMGVLSGFMEHLLRVDGPSIAAVWNRTMRLDSSRYRSGCSNRAHVAECTVRRSRLLTAQHCWI